jgi:NTP pyrophosphatase (non-canonical NTP hydrolase)
MPDFCQAALHDILQERARQDQKWGEQNHDPLEWLGILTEEVGEFAQHANTYHWHPEQCDQAAMFEEAVQVAAVALAIVECLKRGKWWTDD